MGNKRENQFSRGLQGEGKETEKVKAEKGGKNKEIKEGVSAFSRIRKAQVSLFEDMEKLKAENSQPSKAQESKMEELNREAEEIAKIPGIMDRMVDIAINERGKEVQNAVSESIAEIMKEEDPKYGTNTVDKLEIAEVDNGKIIINLSEFRSYFSSSFGQSQIELIKEKITNKFAEKMISILDTASDSIKKFKIYLPGRPSFDLPIPYSAISSKIEFKF